MLSTQLWLGLEREQFYGSARINHTAQLLSSSFISFSFILLGSLFIAFRVKLSSEM